MSKAIRRVAFLLCLVAGGLPSTTEALAKSDLVLAVGGEPETGYDPLFGWGRYGHPLFQSTLLTRDADLAIKPDLATSWTLSDDRLTWTVVLRPNVAFSDGTPLTAKDVAFTFNAAAKAGSAVDLTMLKEATAVDDRTVEIRLKQPWITFIETFFSLGIVPEASYGSGYGRNPIGSGPYRMVSWTEGEQLIVERNPHYYAALPAFDRITFLFTDEDTSLAAAKAGQVDLVSVPAAAADQPPDGFRQINVASVDNRGIAFPIQPAEGRKTDKGEVIGNAVTSDLAVRRAINLGIDRKLLIDVALLGHGRPAFGPADGLAWSNPDAAVSYDPVAARAVLTQAGWSPGADGIFERNGIRAAFPLNYPSSDTTRQLLALTVAEQLKSIGIEATPIGKSWDEIERVMHAEPVVFGWGSHSPLEVFNLYQSALGGVDYFNPGYYANPAVDAHFADAQAAVTLEASYEDWRKAEFDGAGGFGPKADAAWAWLVNLDHIYYVNSCLDIGKPQIEPHGHGWPITAMIQTWTWTCD